MKLALPMMIAAYFYVFNPAGVCIGNHRGRTTLDIKKLPANSTYIEDPRTVTEIAADLGVTYASPYGTRQWKRDGDTIVARPAAFIRATDAPIKRKRILPLLKEAHRELKRMQELNAIDAEIYSAEQIAEKQAEFDALRTELKR